MAAYKKFIFILVLHLAFTFNVIAEDEINLFKGKYIDFWELKTKVDFLSFSITEPSLHGIIKGNNKEKIGFQIDSTYFQFKNLVEKASHPVRFLNGRLLLPRELVESIFIHLMENEVAYRFTEEKLFFNVYGNYQVKPEKIKLTTVVLDPGHGGDKPGAISVFGDPEKNYTLSVSKTVGEILKKKFPELNIVFTRTNDSDVSLEGRGWLANQNLKESNDVIFISIHANSTSIRTETAKGYEIYYLDQNAKKMEDRERTIISLRLVDIKRPVVVQKIHSGMVSSLVQRRSKSLAESVEKKLADTIGARIASRGVKRGPFRVLFKSLMPAILVEVGFLTNPEDARLIADENIQIKIAMGIVEGIKEYVKREYK
ncbi:MAG: N-acetylmuramoyl-L-alanine amidase [Leptospiraceae bacterium]|nr:N-acetylmuramoyl-L-alanine amidase [Leptospiraceae bacterium]